MQEHSKKPKQHAVQKEKKTKQWKQAERNKKGNS